MKRVRILHNSKAGDEEHTKNDLINLIESQGFLSEYSLIKEKNWTKIKNNVDFLAIAGGDGTVRQVIKKLLKRRLVDKRFPMALLPLGTANNLANTLKLADNTEAIISSWKNPKIKKFDVGLIYGLEDASFFLEGVGYGIFPLLMQKMKKIDEKYKDTPEKKLDTALKVLNKIITSYKPEIFTIETDGITHTGKYLLVEIMNSCSIGPNLNLSPQADPGDGRFELVMIPENDKEKIENYVSQKIKGIEISEEFNRITCKKVKISCDSKMLHVDDELIKLRKSKEIEIQLQAGLIEFIV